MFYLARCCVVLLVVTTTTQGITYASSPMEATAIKQQLLKHGVGKVVKVNQTDDKSVRGKIVSVGETSVTLQDGSKPAVEIPFSQVAGVHNGGLSKGAKTTLIVVGSVVIVLVVVAAIIVSRAHLPATIPI